MPSCLPRPRHPGRSGRCGFPPGYRKLAPARKLEWLRGPEAVQLVRAGALQMSQVTAEEKRLGRDRERVRVSAPTPARVDDWERGEPFPPRADDAACAVRRADQVVDGFWEGKVLWPPYYLVRLGDGAGWATYEYAQVVNRLAKGCEDDAARARGHFTTESPSARAIQAAEVGRVEVVSTLKPEFDLETEDRELLKAQVARYLAGAAGVQGMVV